MNFEIQVLNAIQLIRCSFLDALMPMISQGLVLWYFLIGILILCRKTRKAGFIMLAAIGMEFILCNVVMKNVFQRTRPYEINTAITLLVKEPRDYSFPSGHTALSFAAAAGLWFSGTLRRWRIPVLIYASLIAFSRMYLYLHYPTDILMGIAVGIFCGWEADKLVQAFPIKRNSGSKMISGTGEDIDESK